METEDTMCELRQTVQQLESALSTKQATVQQLQEALNARETEISRLRGKLDEQDSLLLRRKQMIAQTTKERDELRQQNAELINKLAVVGRRQSTSTPPKLKQTNSSVSLVNSSSPLPSPSHTPHHPSPTTSRSRFDRRSSSKVDSPLPPIPPPTDNESEQKAKPSEEGSDTDFSDMEDEVIDDSRRKKEQQKNPNTANRHSPSHSTSTSSEHPPERKMSQPKPIIRHSGSKPAVHSLQNVGSPKRTVAFPTHQGLSSISEECQGGPMEKNDTVNFNKERTFSSGSMAGSSVFNGSIQSSPPVSPHNGDDDFDALPRRRVTMSVTDFKKPVSSKNRGITLGEPEDVFNKTEDFEMVQRSRVSTISSSTGRHKEYGRKNSKQLQEEARKLSERTINARHGGRKYQTLELFSPDMELRIREKICTALGKKYGGLAHANRAAICIQTVYRQYRLLKRYEEIRKEASNMRKRAQTMNEQRRKPSMVRKSRPVRYHRQLTDLIPNDPLQKAKFLSRELGKESVPHTSSRRHLVERKRSEHTVLKDDRKAEDAAVANNEVVEMETVVCEIKLDDESTAPAPPLADMVAANANAESTDSSGLPTSFSADVLLTSEGYRRPLSILSVRPSTSVDASLPSHVSGEGDRAIQAVMQGPLTRDARQRKTNLGIGHFNRKPTRGIQYLVKEKVLPDSPQHVATFLAKQNGLSKEKIGEFVGEINSEFHMAVLECLLEQMDMKEKPIDEALRDFQILFRMPGEAQKIDKIMQIFALEYYRFNKEGVIKSEDAAYILSFAIMMLHTSLHNPSVKNRTTKKLWVSMNRGINDGENFPEDFLHDIYDRISKREFTTGEDHTTEVHDIEKNLIGYQNSSRLATPQRRLMCRAQVMEIDQLTSRPSFKNKRRRVLFMFSDLVIICKRRGGDQMEYRGSFSLLDAIAISFETHHYRNGVQIYSSHDEKSVFQCNCDSSEDRVKLLKTLENTISELKELEKERMAELGTSITKTQDVEPERRHRMTSRAGDLLSSAHLDKRQSVRTRRQSKGDFVSGVGDLALSSGMTGNNIVRRTSRSSGTSSQPENRTSGGSHESGYDSHGNTPVPSPSPTNLPHSSKTPLQARPSTTSAPLTLLTPTIVNPVKRSKSTDQIHRIMTITPTLSHDTKTRFSSVEDVRSDSPKSGSASSSPRTSKKKERVYKSEKVKKSRLSSLGSPFRLRRNNRRGSGPAEIRSSAYYNGRPRTASETPSPPPSSDMELSRASAYLVNTT